MHEKATGLRATWGQTKLPECRWQGACVDGTWVRRKVASWVLQRRDARAQGRWMVQSMEVHVHEYVDVNVVVGSECGETNGRRGLAVEGAFWKGTISRRGQARSGQQRHTRQLVGGHSDRKREEKAGAGNWRAAAGAEGTRCRRGCWLRMLVLVLVLVLAAGRGSLVAGRWS